MDIPIANFLSYGFIQRAFIAGSFVAVLCAVLGVFLVLRRFSLIGDGLAHVTFGSIALGLFLRITPLYVSIPLVCLSSLGILKLTDRAHIHGDTAIGVISSLGIAGGVLLVSVAGGFNTDLLSYLFGNILAISSMEVILAVILSVLVILIISFYYHDLIAVTFDEECASVSGIKTNLINKILVLITGLTVVLAMKVVGIMLISALLILPPVTALQLARGFKSTLFISALVSLISVLLGVSVSFYLNLPTGATIVMLNFVFFLAAFLVKKVIR